MAILAAAGLGLFVTGRDGAPRPLTTQADVPAAGEPPGLVAGRARSEPEAPPEFEVLPGPGRAVAEPAGATPPPYEGPKLFPTRVRVERALPDGRAQDVEISEVYVKGNTWDALSLRERPLQVAPGSVINVTLKDSNVAFPLVRTRAPDPVPSELVLRVPSFDDPAIQSLEIQVVDAETSQPLPDAVFEFEDPDYAPLRADADGRIAFEPVKEVFGVRGSGLYRWLAEAGTVRALGHLSFVPRTRLWRGGPHGAPGVEMSDVEAWRKSPVVRVPLRPLPQGVVERRARLLFADGQPASGLLVAVLHPFPCALSGGVRMADVYDGVRRVGPDGAIAFPMTAVAGLEIRKDGLPFHAMHLHADRWPSTGARDVRLPAIADVDVEIVDAPDQDGWWSDTADLLGASKSIGDGPVHPVEADPEATAYLEAKSLCVPTGLASVGGSLDPKHGRLRFALPVGARRVLDVSYGRESRRLHVAPDNPGPHPIRVRWVELPKR